jgi:hypothetical protein
MYDPCNATCIFCFLDLNLEEYLQANKAIKDWNDIESLQILSKADVIGLTTTGAAKKFQLLRMLNPEIMIFEESGQVLGSFQLEFVSISRVINHMTCYNLSALIGGKFI